jgi:hypothetical protein
MRFARLVVLLLLGGVAGGACATSRAQAIEDKPTLAVPPVPPRTIEPQPVAELPRVEPMPESNPVATAPPKPRPNPRNAEAKPAEPKPEATSEAITTPPPAPVAALRAPTAPSGPDALRQIRETLQRADGILAKVDYQKLSLDRRTTYDSAKNYMQQADEKIKQDDLMLARAYAVRAEEIAKQLLETGR